jgi:3-oxoacyl-[acyl-carrier protein] reductase
VVATAAHQWESSLTRKVVLVTGAAQGIGYAAAELAAAVGSTVVIADIQRGRGNSAATGLGARFVELDVTHAESVAGAVSSVVAEFGRIDVLINNAGAALAVKALEMTPDQFHRVLDVDLVGVFRVSSEVARHMIAAGGGAIVNISSVSALIAMYPEPVAGYSAAKAGVAQLTRNLAAEWADHGIRVNSVSPGRVRTELLLDNTDEQMRSIMAAQTPIRRLIEPVEVAQAILFLASDAASAVNGHDLVVDGGLVVV